MPYIKKIFSILCIVSIGFFLWLFLFDKPYPNNINIIAPDLDKFTGETYIARDLAQ